MSSEIDSQISTTLDEKKNIILTLCSNYLTSKLDELYIEKTFSNTDLLLLLDDLMNSLYGLISNQIKQLPVEVEMTTNISYCVNRALKDLKNLWDRGLEKIANKIVRSQMNEKIIFQMFNQIEKTQKNILSNIFHDIKDCMS